MYVQHINIAHFTAQLSKCAARRSANCTVQCKPTVTGEAQEWVLGDLRDFCPVITPSYSPYTSHQSAQYIPCAKYIVYTLYTLQYIPCNTYLVIQHKHSFYTQLYPTHADEVNHVKCIKYQCNVYIVLYAGQRRYKCSFNVAVSNQQQLAATTLLLNVTQHDTLPCHLAGTLSVQFFLSFLFLSFQTTCAG